ncbi:MAG TPA: hypothetical protein VFX50_07130, partial [Gemmatimonadales bacterium]|nr:hypothetical protein [Gemmatimonadales bacterium]
MEPPTRSPSAKLRFPLAALALASVPIVPCLAQAHRAPDVLASYARAKALIDSAVAAHGGLEALRTIDRLHIRLEGYDYHRNQSRRVAAPYDSTPRRLALWIDLPRGRIVNHQTSGYPGGFLYTTRFVSDSARHWFVDVRHGTHSPAQYPPAAQQLGNLFYLPQGYLLAALESNAQGRRRYLGRMRLASGAEVEAVDVPIPNSGIVIGFDPATKRLRAVMSVGTDPFTGEAAVETEFLDYRMIDGVLLPTQAVLRRSGDIIRSQRYTSASRISAIPDSLLAPPSGSTEVAQT